MERLLIASLLMASACDDGPAEAPADPIAALEVVGDDPSDHPIAGLDDEWQRRFVVGDALFEQVFGPEDGLGPRWTRTSCEACHENDARGPGMVRRALGAEGFEPGELVHPFALEGYERTLPEGAQTSARMGPALFGRGWIEAVRADAIEAGARAQADHPEVSGRVARVPLAMATPAQRPFHDHAAGAENLIGRFGLKARHPTIDDFVADAYLLDMGLSSPARPTEADGDQRPGTDITLDQVHAVADYVRLLRIPERADASPEGQAIFATIGCATCHTPSMPTRADYPVPQIAGKDAPIYSDLLLHDMGESLSDGVSDHTATAREWRTAPLIGLRHLRAYLHDGRADTLDEAIRAHAGEAAATTARYDALTPATRTPLLTFLEAL
ncbi:MAG: hypothetical protein JJ863_07215 [Deltaproteobacteria bacterium]|nr:hypothetical protein [Deltaproteobacteria bacterium]